MRRTVPSRGDRADGNCGRLVGGEAAPDPERHLARRRAQRRAGREPGALDARGGDRLRAGLRPRRSIAGFDFSFGVPEWFAREHGCTTIDEVWALAARDGERWLAPTPPFWRTRCDGAARAAVPAVRGARTRPRSRSSNSSATARSARVGARHAARGRVARGRRRDLAVRRRRGTDGFEIYPSALRGSFPRRGPFDERARTRRGVFRARDVAAYRETVAALRAATDPTTRLEGDIWAPTPPQSDTASP